MAPLLHRAAIMNIVGPVAKKQNSIYLLDCYERRKRRIVCFCLAQNRHKAVQILLKALDQLIAVPHIALSVR